MLSFIDDTTKEAVAVFTLFAFAIKGRYLALSTTHRAVTPSAINSLRNDCLLSASLMIKNIDHIVATYAETVGASGNETIKRKQVLHTTLQNIAAHCSASIMRDLHQTAAQPRTHDSMGLLAQRRAAEPIFVVPDSRGRTWRAETLLKTAVRDFAYSSYLDTALNEIVTQGGDLAQVVYPNPKHPDHNLVFSISGAAGHLALNDIRARIFHPNSSAEVIAYVPTKH